MGSSDFDKISTTSIFVLYKSNDTVGFKYKCIDYEILSGKKCSLEGLYPGGQSHCICNGSILYIDVIELFIISFFEKNLCTQVPCI